MLFPPCRAGDEPLARFVQHDGHGSTMASMADALGIALSGNAAVPAVDSSRRVTAQLHRPAHRADARSGYAMLYRDHVTGGADTGADFDFLKGVRGNAVTKDSH